LEVAAQAAIEVSGDDAAGGKVTATGNMLFALANLAGKLGSSTVTFQDRVDSFKQVADSGIAVASLFMGPWGPMTAVLGTLVVHGVAALFGLFGPQVNTPSPLEAMYTKIMNTMVKYVQKEIIANQFALSYAKIMEEVKVGAEYSTDKTTSSLSDMRNEILDAAIRQEMVAAWGPACWVSETTLVTSISGAYKCSDYQEAGSAVMGLPMAGMHVSLLMDKMINHGQKSKLFNLQHMTDTANKYYVLAAAAVDAHKKHQETCWDSKLDQTSEGFFDLFNDSCIVKGTWDFCANNSMVMLGSGPDCDSVKGFPTNSNDKTITITDIGHCNSESSNRYLTSIHICMETYKSQVRADLSSLYDRNLEGFKGLKDNLTTTLDYYKKSVQS